VGGQLFQRADPTGFVAVSFFYIGEALVGEDKFRFFLVERREGDGDQHFGRTLRGRPAPGEAQLFTITVNTKKRSADTDGAFFRFR
jgi:hypothetical protein